ncbi:hypothetical protein [Stutzerimonas nitrititolerans]|uniref:hypothetical protein n=1 Tax=Stutzerimonas nitrititolerans TaxID=2482751 RepID=UPI0028AE98EB|nr:hypothetical protein [Stutzerimonas nitrititolerans]
MYIIPIDEAGFIDNPHVSESPEHGCKRPWGALVFRRGKKVIFAAFLPREKDGIRIDVKGIMRGAYLAFGSTGEKGKTRSLYVVEQVTETELSLRPIEDAAVPTIYDFESIRPSKLYLLEAKQAMIEVQIENLRSELSELKRG